MNIKKLHIKNFKSLVDVEIIDPNPFTVFVGPNGSGKSNIFEAIEFQSYLNRFGSNEAISLFGNINILCRKNHLATLNKIKESQTTFSQNITFSDETSFNEVSIETKLSNNNAINAKVGFGFITYSSSPADSDKKQINTLEFKKFVSLFSRIFIGNSKLKKLNLTDSTKLNIDTDNLESVLERILTNKSIATELIEYMQLLVPGLEDIKVESTPLSKTNELLIYEKGYDSPFSKKLISDGTYNILALLVSVFQSEEPQFLCIEEPENGLHPYAIKEIVTFFREQCREKGHYIWLNTHSQTLVNQLNPEEIIIVNKKDGDTVIKQFQGKEMHGMAMDTAWLTNYFGGGLPW